MVILAMAVEARKTIEAAYIVNRFCGKGSLRSWYCALRYWVRYGSRR